MLKYLVNKTIKKEYFHTLTNQCRQSLKLTIFRDNLMFSKIKKKAI